MVQSFPHLPGMVKDSPGIDDGEPTEARQIALVEDRSFFDRPENIAGKVTPLQLGRAGHRLRVVVEGMDHRTQPSRCQRKQTTATTYVQESLFRQLFDLEHLLERCRRRRNALFVQAREKTAPVLAEFKPVPLGDLFLLGTHGTSLRT